MKPRKILLEEGDLIVEWDSAEPLRIPVGMLRRWCPCAACTSGREQEGNHFIPLLSKEQTKIIRASAIGNYALQILWEDGHNTGIYEFTSLPKIAALSGKIVTLDK